MRRPQKPFTVEVKRARKGAVVKLLGAEALKTEADQAEPSTRKRVKALEAAASPRESPPRRILEAIEAPASPDLSSELLQPDAIVAIATSRRPRGRPPKAPASGPATQPPRAAAKARKVAAPRKKPLAIEVVLTLAAPSAPAADALAGRVFHGERAEEANSLPRGARWKRRLPKVLW